MARSQAFIPVHLRAMLPSATSTPATWVAPSLFRRMASWLYEGVILFGVVTFPALIFGIATQTRNAMDHRHALQTLVFVVVGAYFVLFWCRGQTLPMKTWKIRIVDRFGAPVRWPRALARYLLAWVWFLPPFAVLAPFRLRPAEVTVLVLGWIAIWALLSRFRRDHQFLHDAWVGTRIVAVDADGAPLATPSKATRTT